MSEHLVTDAEAGAAGHQNYPISIEETMRRLLTTREVCKKELERIYRSADAYTGAYATAVSPEVFDAVLRSLADPTRALLAELRGEKR